MSNTFSLENNCYFAKVNRNLLTKCKPFSCGESDLNDFFYNDSLNYDTDLMGKTYCWVLKDDITRIVGFVTLANAGVQTTHMNNNPRRHINKGVARNKQGRTYPAVLIGRIAVDKDFQGKEFRVGAQIMSFVKDWFLAEDNKTGCRFVLVDAVNSPHPLSYYERNGFKPLFPKIDDEKEFYHIPKDENLKTRMYYFDLLLLK